MRALSVVLMVLISVNAWGGGASTPSSLRIAVIKDVPINELAISRLTQAYERLGIELEPIYLPSRRALFAAHSGELDGDLYRAEFVARDHENLLRVPHVLMKGQLFAVFPPAGEAIEHYENARVAVRRGVLVAEKRADSVAKEVERANTYQQIRYLLEHGRVDMAFISVIEGHSPLAQPEWLGFTVHPQPVLEFNLYHYIHKRHEALVTPLSEALDHLCKSSDG